MEQDQARRLTFKHFETSQKHQLGGRHQESCKCHGTLRKLYRRKDGKFQSLSGSLWHRYLIYPEDHFSNYFQKAEMRWKILLDYQDDNREGRFTPKF